MSAANSNSQPITYTLEPNRDYRDQSPMDDQQALKADATKHYDECYRDYLFAWCNSDNLALHYGYWDEAKPYQQHQALLNKNQVLYEKAGIQAGDKVLWHRWQQYLDGQTAWQPGDRHHY
jgi:hypothetical protein